ncbi:MAG: purine-nucleoside phosphorylase [Verrucomicrobiaceae bacterium]|nr:purine-nucleoside phosphorylase [Verrucomicrobiaceae bacterium]
MKHNSPVDLPSAISSWKPKVGVVLGSGLGGFVSAMDVMDEIEYSAVDAIPAAAVSGHAGKLVYGSVEGVHLVAAQGRVHLYEGYSPVEVTAVVRLIAAMGIDLLLLTNAAGVVNEEFAVGDWMQISDQLNLTGTSPLLGEGNFLDMSSVYSAEFRGRFSRAAKLEGIALHEGVYAGMLGPQYETPAEVRMLKGLGADAVGMSTVLEAIQARALGLEVAGFSCLTNYAAGLAQSNLDHGEVIKVGRQAAGNMVNLLLSVLRNLN